MSTIVKTNPQLIIKPGKPNAVVLDIEYYRKMLERLEAREDLDDLAKIRFGVISFGKSEDFLADPK